MTLVRSQVKPKPKAPTKCELSAVRAALGAGANEEVAGLLAGHNGRWLRLCKAYYPRLAGEVAEWKQLADGLVKMKMWENATLRNNVIAQIFWLKNRAGWADRKIVSGSIRHDHYPRAVQESASREIDEIARKELAAAGHDNLPDLPVIEAELVE